MRRGMTERRGMRTEEEEEEDRISWTFCPGQISGERQRILCLYSVSI